MTTPPTRAEFDALAKRVADLEMDALAVRRNADHAPTQPVPAAMPKCPRCQKELVAPSIERGIDRNHWACCVGTPPCRGPAVAVCGVDCAWAYCAAHLQNPEDARCPSVSDQGLPCQAPAGHTGEHRALASTQEIRERQQPAQPPAPAEVTTAKPSDAAEKAWHAWEAACTTWLASLEGGDVDRSDALEEAFDDAVQDYAEAAVEAATKPLRDVLEAIRKAAGASSLMYLDIEVAKLAKAAVELREIRERWGHGDCQGVLPTGLCASCRRLAELLTKAGG